jgi:4'-phosphopantetheinyl transferase
LSAIQPVKPATHRLAETPTDADRLLALSPSEIHLWLAFYEEAGEELHGAYREILEPAEKEREPRFYFAADRRRYLVTRALVRTVLARYVPLAPRDWRFAANAYGRPEIASPQGRRADLSFNVSHTRDLIVLGVTRGRALGVDVENIGRREAVTDVARRYFAPVEVSALARVPAAQQRHRFFEYWTFKESYIKARGMGLSLPLDRFSVHFPDDRTVELRIDRDLGDDARRWELVQLRPTPEYLLAVCAERVAPTPSQLVVRQTVPLSSEKLLALPCARVRKRASSGRPTITTREREMTPHERGRSGANASLRSL